ncbi:MAG: IclR family transcriptional regulator [Candidatus Planktophila sp.]|jgi:DNA-binding IclR family transcriptional regulator
MSEIMDEGLSGSRYTIASAARGLDVLEAMAKHGKPMSASEIAAAVSIPRPTTFRILATLQERDWVYKEGLTYGLGFKCFNLGANTGAGLEIRTQAIPFLVELRDRTLLNTQIAKMENWKVVYLERILARNLKVNTPSRAGSILPAHCTALGKTLLSAKDLEQVSEWATKNTLERFTESTICKVPNLMAEISRIRERGYAVEEGEREPEISCIAAPIRDFSGKVIAALSISGTRDRFPENLIGGDFARLVVSTAAKISRAMGAPATSTGTKWNL